MFCHAHVGLHDGPFATSIFFFFCSVLAMVFLTKTLGFFLAYILSYNLMTFDKLLERFASGRDKFFLNLTSQSVPCPALVE
jgi:hypothetical protein